MATPVQPTTTNSFYSGKTNATTNTSFGALLEPGLRKIFFETYAEVPEQFSKLFKVGSSKKAKETDFGLGAFGDWAERTSEFSEVDYATLDTGYEREYVHKAYTKGFMIGRELYDDEQYRQINKFPAAMARAGRAYVEKQVAGFMHNSFTTALFDGKPLIANDHPLINGGVSVGDNLVTGALSDTNLKIALQNMRETTDEAGNLINCSAKKLFVPPALEYTAKEIINSTQKAGTTANDANTVKGALEVVVYDYLGLAAGGSDTAWYIVDPNIAELNFFWRTKPEFKWDEDFDTFVAKYRGYMRFSFGASDWRGIVGSTGL
jgi:phage major head subunit gpT-like protein